MSQPGEGTLSSRVAALQEENFSADDLSEANDLLPLVREEGNPELLIDLLLWMSSYDIQLGNYSHAMELCVEAAAISRRICDVERSAHVELRIGNINFRTGKHDSAISTFEALVEKYKALGDTLQACYVEINIALNYYALEELEAARQQLLSTRVTMAKYGTPRDLLSVDRNLGVIYALEGEPKKSLPYNKQSLETILAEQDTFQFAPVYGNLAYTFQQLGDFDKALVYYDSSLYYSRLLEQDAITYVTLLDISDGYQMRGDYKKALEYFQEYHNVQASVLNESTLNRIAELEVEHETARERLALEASEQKILALEQKALVRGQRLVMIATGLISSLVFAFLIFWYWRKDARYRDTQKKLIASELANERLASGQLNSKLENQQEDLTDFALDIERKNKFSRELSERLNALKKQLPAHLRPQLEELIHFNQEHGKLNEHLEVVQENIDLVNHEFRQKLRAAFPKLTSTDLALAGMIRLNMTNKEVATNRGISTASAKMARYRLRKKLKLEPNEDIHVFLREL